MRAAIEVLVELCEVVPAGRRNESHHVIGDQSHQDGDDRQGRVLLSEVLRNDDIASVWHQDHDP